LPIKPSVKAIREIEPDAKIILVGSCPLAADFILQAVEIGMLRPEK
jgi:hypothetical protein